MIVLLRGSVSNAPIDVGVPNTASPLQKTVSHADFRSPLSIRCILCRVLFDSAPFWFPEHAELYKDDGVFGDCPERPNEPRKVCHNVVPLQRVE